MEFAELDLFTFDMTHNSYVQTAKLFFHTTDLAYNYAESKFDFEEGIRGPGQPYYTITRVKLQDSISLDEPVLG